MDSVLLSRLPAVTRAERTTREGTLRAESALASLALARGGTRAVTITVVSSRACTGARSFPEEMVEETPGLATADDGTRSLIADGEAAAEAKAEAEVEVEVEVEAEAGGAPTLSPPLLRRERGCGRGGCGWSVEPNC